MTTTSRSILSAAFNEPRFGSASSQLLVVIEELGRIHCGRGVQLPKLAAHRPQRLAADRRLYHVHELDEFEQEILDPWFHRALFPIEALRRHGKGWQAAIRRARPCT